MNPNAVAYPRVKKCFLCIDLKLGVMMYIMMEMMIWIFFSYASLDCETEFLNNYDLYKFEEHIEDSWYYGIMFGLPEEEDYDYEEGFEAQAEDSDGIDIEFRFQNIVVNGGLMMLFIGYFIVALLFLIGILKKNTNFFIPYIILDVFLIWMAIILVIGGLFYVNLVLIRNCSIFASVKLYPAVCNLSLFKKMNGKFEFSRDVPSAIGPPIQFNSNRKSYEKKKKRDKSDLEELKVLNTKTSIV